MAAGCAPSLREQFYSARQPRSAAGPYSLLLRTSTANTGAPSMKSIVSLPTWKAASGAERSAPGKVHDEPDIVGDGVPGARTARVRGQTGDDLSCSVAGQPTGGWHADDLSVHELGFAVLGHAIEILDRRFASWPHCQTKVSGTLVMIARQAETCRAERVMSMHRNMRRNRKGDHRRPSRPDGDPAVRRRRRSRARFVRSARPRSGGQRARAPARPGSRDYAGRVTAPSAADETSATYFANTPLV